MLSLSELIAAVEKEKNESLLLELVRTGGKKASEQKALARLAICAGCEYNGKVEPLPGEIFHGCTKCNCPFASKAYMDTILFKKIKCPHPLGDKWEGIKSK